MRPGTVDDPFAVDRLNGVADFLPEWDVPSLGKRFTDDFSAAIDEVRANPRPDPRRKVRAFIGQAGYGKTHLFGRLQHRHQGQIFLAFIAAPPGREGETHPEAIESSLRWQVVESLLSSSHAIAPFRVELARLLVPSFIAYFDQLGPAWKARSASVRNALEQDPLTVLELFGHVERLAPYHQLADAVRSALPECSSAVLRALILSSSPAGDDVRWWLRGEADQVPAARLEALHLLGREGNPLPSPPLVEILRATAEILKFNRVPLVLCFDQLEELFKADRAGFSTLTGQIMSWIQTVPNLLVGIGCMEDVWKEIRQGAGFKSFLDRVSVHELPPLSGVEAVGMVTRRMASWSEFDAKRSPGWPFDLDSLRRFADRDGPSPRHLIQNECAPRFNEWLSRKQSGEIQFDGGAVIVPPAEAFRLEWAKTLDSIRAERRTASDTHESDLWAGVQEALLIAQRGGYSPTSSHRIERIETQPLPATASDPRHSALVHLACEGKSRSVLVAVSKKDGGQAFGKWYGVLNDALVGPVLGAVVIWPRASLSVGKTTASYRNYADRIDAGSVRPFPLDEHETTFQQLECLRQLSRRAGTDLILNGVPISKDDFLKLVVETGVVGNLKLYEFLFHNWKGLSPEPVANPLDSPLPPVVSRPTSIAASPAVPSVPAVAESPPIRSARSTSTSPLPVQSPVSADSVPKQPWAEGMLQKACEYLKKRGQLVHALGTELGPTFVRLKVELRGDADFGRIRKQAENLKVHLALQQDPLIASQAGYVSIDLQRPDRQVVDLPPLLGGCPDKFQGEPAFPAGVDVSGSVAWLNLSEPESCHLLVAGTTGSGKSEFLKAMLAALAARLEPSQVSFRLIDPKRVTFHIDPRCPYLGGPVVYDGDEAVPVLEECVEEMERRYRLLQTRSLDHVRHLSGADAVPRWIVVFDEFADLMTDKATKRQLEPLLKRLGAKARAAGIHLVLGTQRPEASVVTPVLRSNLPGRIGLQVATERESKLFLDEPDAAYLFGKGDLVWKRGAGLVRLQSPFVPRPELEQFLRVTG